MTENELFKKKDEMLALDRKLSELYELEFKIKNDIKHIIEKMNDFVSTISDDTVSKEPLMITMPVDIMHLGYLSLIVNSEDPVKFLENYKKNLEGIRKCDVYYKKGIPFIKALIEAGSKNI